MEPLATAPPRPNTDVIGPYLEALGEVRIGLADPIDVGAMPNAGTLSGEVWHDADHDNTPGGIERGLAIPVDTRIFSHHYPSWVSAGIEATQDIHIVGLHVQEAAAVAHDHFTRVLDVDRSRGDQLDQA